jgi:hypothetical protein
MEIVITVISHNIAVVRIDGIEFVVKRKGPGSFEMQPEPEDGTLGKIVAAKAFALASQVITAQRVIFAEHGRAGTWDNLPEEVICDVKGAVG